MTEAHEPDEIDGPHEGPIKTPKQLILAVLYAFVVPIIGIILLVMFVTTEKRPAAGSDALEPQAVAERIRAGRHGRGQGRLRPRVAEDRRAGLRRRSARPATRPARSALRSSATPPPGGRASRPASTRCSTRRSPARARCRRRAAATSATSRSRRAVVYMANKGGAKFAEPTAPSRRAPRRAAAADRSDAQAPRRCPIRTPAAGATPTTALTRRCATRRRTPSRECAAASRCRDRTAATRHRAATAAAPPLYAQTCAPAMPPASPVRPRSATRPLGHRESPKASTG